MREMTERLATDPDLAAALPLEAYLAERDAIPGRVAALDG